MINLGTEMDVENPLIEWYIHEFHRLVQGDLVHRVFVERRHDLARLSVVARAV